LYHLDMSNNVLRVSLGACATILLGVSSAGWAVTATFIDRELPTDVRVVTYNVLNDAIFPETNPTRAERFARVAAAVDADVWVLQELFNHSGPQVQSLFNSIAPLEGGASWNVYKSSGEFAIVSRDSLSLTRSNTSPAGAKPVAAALVNLPNATYAKDLYLMNAHFKAFSGTTEQAQRQADADAIINWMRDARTAGGTINLASGTPMVALGDFNIVDGPQPLNTVIDGNIINEATYGVDSPPDWDGTSSTDPVPTHNATGSTTWTWRQDGSGFAPSRLDYVVYTDSVISAPHKFVLNTFTMTAADRAATGLFAFDVTLDNTGNNYDHLPVVVDFRFGSARTLVWNPPDTGWTGSNHNWLNGSASAVFANGDVVRFKDSGVGTVAIQAAGVSPTAVIVSNTTGTYRFIGGAIGGSSSLTKSGNGTLILGAANGYAGGTVIGGGTLIVDHPAALGVGPLQVLAGGRVKSSPGLTQAIRITGLTINAGGSFDLSNDDLVIDYTGATSASDVRAMLIDGRIVSSLASASQRLGYVDNMESGLVVFGGQSVDPTSILVKYTYVGDADLDGVVDIGDLGKLASAWQTGGVWFNGDFDYNGTVNINDLGLLASNWQAGVSAVTAWGEALSGLGLPAVNVPEPASLGITLPALIGVCARRRR
jgi:autotransporter-associated beta strand protein